MSEVKANGESAESELNGYEKNNEKVMANCAWITEDFLQEVLRDHENNDQLKVLDHKVCAAVGVGDNYLSILYRTTVNFVRTEGGEVETRRLMIKGAPVAKFLVEFIESLGIFAKELSMYNNCLPAMKHLQEVHFPEETRFIAAEGYKSPRENTIVMEDLADTGYKMADRRKQLDFDHCVVTLTTLARFHALSVKLLETQPEIITEVSSEFYTEENREKMAPYLEKCFPVLGKEIEGWGEYSRFARVVEELGKHTYDKLLYLVKPKPGRLLVLNHGDTWVNNMLYQYDEEGNVVHAKLVDFQLSRVVSPAMDLIYFLFTSPQAKVLCERMYELLQIYHTALISDLKQLDVNAALPSLEDLHEDMKDKAFFGMIVLSTILPIIVAKPADAMDLDNFDPEDIKEGDDYPLVKNYRDTHYQKTAGQFLVHLEKTGFLECAKERLRDLEEQLGNRAEDKVEKVNGS